MGSGVMSLKTSSIERPSSRSMIRIASRVSNAGTSSWSFVSCSMAPRARCPGAFSEDLARLDEARAEPRELHPELLGATRDVLRLPEPVEDQAAGEDAVGEDDLGRAPPSRAPRGGRQRALADELGAVLGRDVARAALHVEVLERGGAVARRQRVVRRGGVVRAANEEARNARRGRRRREAPATKTRGVDDARGPRRAAEGGRAGERASAARRGGEASRARPSTPSRPSRARGARDEVGRRCRMRRARRAELARSVRRVDVAKGDGPTPFAHTPESNLD